jgi:peptidoglycan/xylan/chitin deacetylase (PgdA/CDA1 family)
MKSEHCDHEYAEPVEDEFTGDLVSECCKCETTLGVCNKHDIADHWYDHRPKDSPHIMLASDILNGEYPTRGDDADRYVTVCGACQHMNGAVFGGYFDQFEKPINETDAAFIDRLREALCADCGATLFRDSQLVMAYSDAVQARRETDLTRHVKNTADAKFWSGKSDSRYFDPGYEWASKLLDLEYEPRCPCCGYATDYGDREFDFHHWDYDNDRGCILCRNCHKHIHRGGTVSDQKDIVDNWKADAIQRLHDRATGKFLEINSASEMVTRFNIKLPSMDTVPAVRMMIPGVEE